MRARRSRAGAASRQRRSKKQEAEQRQSGFILHRNSPHRRDTASKIVHRRSLPSDAMTCGDLMEPHRMTFTLLTAARAAPSILIGHCRRDHQRSSPSKVHHVESPRMAISRETLHVRDTFGVFSTQLPFTYMHNIGSSAPIQLSVQDMIDWYCTLKQLMAAQRLPFSFKNRPHAWSHPPDRDPTPQSS